MPLLRPRPRRVDLPRGAGRGRRELRGRPHGRARPCAGGGGDRDRPRVPPRPRRQGLEPGCRLRAARRRGGFPDRDRRRRVRAGRARALAGRGRARRGRRPERTHDDGADSRRAVGAEPDRRRARRARAARPRTRRSLRGSHRRRRRLRRAAGDPRGDGPVRAGGRAARRRAHDPQSGARAGTADRARRRLPHAERDGGRFRARRRRPARAHGRRAGRAARPRARARLPCRRRRHDRRRRRVHRGVRRCARGGALRPRSRALGVRRGRTHGRAPWRRPGPPDARAARGAARGGARMTDRLIIDTDTAGDDVTSLLIALLHPNAQLDAITICNGNVAFDQQVENALYTVEQTGKNVPVYPGCPKPLVADWVDAAYVHGEDGMGDSFFPKAALRPAPEHAVDELVRRIGEAPGEINLLAQAPLTNIATAVTRDPSIAQKVKRLWIMGGGVGNVTPAAEFNFYVDPEAAKIVFKAGLPMTLFTWTLTLSHGVFFDADLARIEAVDTPLARFYRQVTPQADEVW